MLAIPGYAIGAKIATGAHTVVYRGRSVRDGIPVIIKTITRASPRSNDVARLKREYEITRALDLEGVVKPYALAPYRHGVALILEDFGGESLAHAIASGPARGLDVQTFLTIACSLAETVGALHKLGVIHRDIKPAHVIVNPTSGQVKLTGFGIASSGAASSSWAFDPSTSDDPQGTPAYMSPEQTGRMNRRPDHRTDCYSLGATFYEMLTRMPPFQVEEPAALIHAHLAKTPESPVHLRSDLPQALAEIVLKCLSKAADDRYQSAVGLKADLAAVFSRWRTGDAIEPFPLGRYDRLESVPFSQRLYGRERELGTLLAACDRASQGGTETVLVTGETGVGKSRLVHELQDHVARQRGSFLCGKFDQFQQDMPYRAITQAFSDLVRHLLMESEEAMAAWRTAWTDAFGVNGRVITSVIPAVELIVGQQPPAPDLPPAESRNRFKLAFQQFIGACAGMAHPLVLFLDDVQWADASSFALVEVVMADPAIRSLLLILAYRDQEVGAAHPLKRLIAPPPRRGETVSISAPSSCTQPLESRRLPLSDGRHVRRSSAMDANPHRPGVAGVHKNPRASFFCEGNAEVPARAPLAGL